MGTGPTTSDDRSSERDADAPWRPGFDGWKDPESDRNALLDRTLADDQADDLDDDQADDLDDDQADDLADGERWSRERDQAEPELWLPVRPERPLPRRPPAMGRPLAVVEGLPARAVTGELVLVAVALVSILLAVAVIVVALRPVGNLDSPSATIVPERADERWTRAVDVSIDAVAVGDGVLVASAEASNLLYGFDVVTGDELWVRPGIDAERRIDQIAVVDAVVIVQRRGADGAPGVTAIDASTGVTLWTSDSDASYTLVDVDAGHAIVRRFRLADRSRLEVIDAATGAVVGDSIVLGDVSVPGPYYSAATRDGRVAVWSIESLAPVSAPVQSFNLRTIAEWDGGAVALDLDGRIVAFDRTGERTDERPFVGDAIGESTSRADLAGVVDDADIGIIASSSSIGFRVTDGQIETVWQLPGRVFTPVETESGMFSVLVGPDASGEINATIIDPADGDTVTVTDDGVTRETEPVLGHNAYVIAPEIGAVERVVSAHGYDGRKLWSLRLSPTAGYEVVDGLVVVLERGANRSTITVNW